MDHVTTLALGLVYSYGWVGNKSHSTSLFCGTMVTYDYDFNFAQEMTDRHYQAHWHRFHCYPLYEQSLATDPASTADETSLVPDLYTIHSVIRFGDMDISAGRSTEARVLPHAFPTYDPRDTLAQLCQKHRSCQPDRPSLCSGYHRQETKFIVRPCGETR